MFLPNTILNIDHYSSFASFKLKLFCTDCNPVCPFEWEPVCGSNGITYDNFCILNYAMCTDESIRLSHNGPCKLNGKYWDRLNYVFPQISVNFDWSGQVRLE